MWHAMQSPPDNGRVFAAGDMQRPIPGERMGHQGRAWWQAVDKSLMGYSSLAQVNRMVQGAPDGTCGLILQHTGLTGQFTENIVLGGSILDCVPVKSDVCFL